MKQGIGNTIVNLRKDSGGPSFTGMITEWTVTAGQTIRINSQRGVNNNFDVDWGDGNEETGITVTDKTHTYTDAGTYTVKFSGQYNGFRMGESNGLSQGALTKFVQWGTETIIKGTYQMFKDCTNMLYEATDSPTITLDTSITNYNFSRQMFQNASSVENLNLSDWNWTNPELITTSNEMFENCTDLESINLTGWNFINSNDIIECFRSVGTNTSGTNLEWNDATLKCNNFTNFCRRANFSSFQMNSLNLTSPTTANFGSAFYEAQLPDLDFSTWSNTDKINNLSNTFRDTNGTSNQEWELNLTNWDTSNVTTMALAFYFARYLTNIVGLSGLSGDSLTSTGFQQTFQKCERLTFNENNFNADFGLNWGATTMSSTFAEVGSLTTGSDAPIFTNWNTSIITNLSSTFKEFKFQPNTTFNMFDVSSATGMISTFHLTENLETLDMSNSNMSNTCTNLTSFCRESGELTTVDFSNCDFSNVTTFLLSFYRCPITSITFDAAVDFGSLINASNFLTNSGVIGSMTTAEYDAFLVRLDTTGLSGAYILSAGVSTYTTGGAGDTARASLVTKGWSITDGGGV